MKKYYIQPEIMIENVTLFSNLMAISTMGVSEEGDDQFKARAPRRSMSF